MGPDPELIQSITGKEVCFNGKTTGVLWVFCVCHNSESVVSLSPLFISILGCRGCIKKEKHLEANCVCDLPLKKNALEILWEDGNPLLLGTFLLGCPTCFALVVDPS